MALSGIEVANDEVERRGASPTTNEADLSQSSTPSLAQRRRNPRSLEPIVGWRIEISVVELERTSTSRVAIPNRWDQHEIETL